MFDPVATPRVFALPSGVDFPKVLLDGLMDRLVGHPPEALARVQIIVNTRRMERRLRALMEAGSARFLPRISLLTDLDQIWPQPGLPPATPGLRRRLELSILVGKLLEQEQDLGAQGSVFDLADSLAELMDEMQGEGVSVDTIRNLDVTDMSGHWARAQQFISIADDFVESDSGTLDSQARQRRIVEDLARRWAIDPPRHPVLLAGSTGSRGTTLMLMQAVASLPQGAVILPGFDFDQPDSVWTAMDKAMLAEDHPQFRFRRLMQKFQLEPHQITRWFKTPEPEPARNKLISLALRPAPVTDAWMREGPKLPDLAQATSRMTLIEAETPRDEALAIALRLRKAAGDGQSAALITPDRMLTRRVASALDRWGILPDDSAGTPLQLTPPGRFLRHVAQIFAARLTGAALITLLKHPLCHGGTGRGDHLRQTRDLELDLRAKGPAFPDPDSFALYAKRRNKPDLDGWMAWMIRCFCDQQVTGALPLTEWVDRLRDLSEAIASGHLEDGSGPLWDQNAGQKALGVIDALTEHARHGADMTPSEFGDLLGSLLAGEEVRDRDAPDSRIMIWGTLEARVQGADLLILGGLNEGSWPEPARPDSWLNRALRDQAGLLLPERRIGLAAHDFQQAIAAPDVWLTRSVRSEDAETVASRWINRLTNLLDGLPEHGGRTALKDMRERGAEWLTWARNMEQAAPLALAPRPAPRPPVTARPVRMSVTEIKRLVRDPYAIYAKHVLHLSPLNPLLREPDALQRGIVVHEILEDFIRNSVENPALLTVPAFLDTCRTALKTVVPWPSARSLWLAKLGRVAGDFITSETERRALALPVKFEAKVTSQLADLGFTLTGRADRIDRDTEGRLHIYDYKTGTPPSIKVQKQFDKQLLLEIAMAEEDGFEDIGPSQVARAVFLGVGSSYSEVAAPMADEPPAKTWEDLRALITAYRAPEQGFTSRRMVQKDTDTGDFDHLARFGEWDDSAPPCPEDLT